MQGGFEDPLGMWRATPPCPCEKASPPCPRGTPYQGQGDGFPSVRWAFTQSLALPNTFQAVALDTPSAYGSVHSPYKQPVASRLARAALAAVYGDAEHAAVSPHVVGVALVNTVAVNVTLGGLGTPGIELRAPLGFELLCQDDVWHSAAVSARDVSGPVITLPVPAGCAGPRGIRYLWYDTPCSNYPYQCPIYTRARPLGTLSGELEPLPLGPFIQQILA